MKIKKLESIFIKNNNLNFKYILEDNSELICDEIFFNNNNANQITTIDEIIKSPENIFFKYIFTNNFNETTSIVLPTTQQYEEYLKIKDNNNLIFNYTIKYSLSILFLIKIFSKSKNDYLNIYEVLKYKFFKNYIENYSDNYTDIKKYIDKLFLNEIFLKNRNIFKNIVLDLNSNKILKKQDIFLEIHKTNLENEFFAEEVINKNKCLILGLSKDFERLKEKSILIDNINDFNNILFKKNIFINLDNISYDFFKYILEIIHFEINIVAFNENNLLKLENNENEIKNDTIEDDNIEEFNYFLKDKRKKDKMNNQKNIGEPISFKIETIPFVFTESLKDKINIFKNAIFFNLKINNNKIKVNSYIYNILKLDDNFNNHIEENINYNIEENKLFFINDYNEIYKIFKDLNEN